MKSPIEVHVILVGTLYSRNLGSCSRVMANMGGGRLITIDEKCDYNLDARQGAAGAQTHLLERIQYKNWDEFFAKEPDGIRVAFCARDKFEADTVPYENRAQAILTHVQSHSTPRPLYLIFGPEDHGLTKQDLEYANFICGLPVYGTYKSMNLSHAVLLALYITHNTAQNKLSQQPQNIEVPMDPDVEFTESDRFFFPDKGIKDWLNELGFEFGERRKDVYKTLKRILLHNMATAKDLRILEAVIFQTARKLRDKKD